ncbi:MAG: hypothetical protein IJ638_03565 [Alphaproteobacteria bacterium]|nr:hypothetical protein [Alphaproteobacteria bacterium]
MKYVNKLLPANPERKIEKLQAEIFSIEQYCRFMASLEGVEYDTRFLMARKEKCEKKLVHIRVISEGNIK